MSKKNLIMVLFAITLILLSGTMAEAKTNPKLAVKTKAVTAG